MSESEDEDLEGPRRAGRERLFHRQEWSDRDRHQQFRRN